jgi:alpha-beta hydrolase superfamily lysophospholipase
LKVLAARIVGKVVPFMPVSTGLTPEHLTRDPEMQAWTKLDPLYLRSTTPRFFEEATRTHAAVRNRASRFSYPLLVLLGTSDPVASFTAGRAFFEAAGSADKELRTYEGFRHELFNEIGRERPVADTVAWIGARVRAAQEEAAVAGAEAAARLDPGA